MPERDHSQEPGDRAEAMIRLVDLEKRYPGDARAAVTGLNLDVPEGEIVVLVGPSGCGKTTTLKMINRLIEPTAGRIYLGGQDVTSANADRLRRRIGYVIQQVGLFPHQTIAENIAVVPRMLGWDKARIARRVDELLELVGMDPGRYRRRYPKELSGGQQQRVGVARALGADPPVMLMDEPFGAIDPITRDRLQHEFLRIQHDIKKTIVFVTHDIDEAIKLGDRIAVLAEGSRVAQYAPPAELLTDPADDFVRSFTGAGASVKRLTLTKLAQVRLDPWPTVTAGSGEDQVAGVFARCGEDFLLRLDGRRHPVGWVARADALAGPDAAWLPTIETLRPTATLYDALNTILASALTCAVVVSEAGEYLGTIGFARIQTLMHAPPADAAMDMPAGPPRDRVR